MSNVTRMIGGRVWAARQRRPFRGPGPTLYAGVAADGTRFLHAGDNTPVQLVYTPPYRVRKPYVKPADRKAAAQEQVLARPRGPRSQP